MNPPDPRPVPRIRDQQLLASLHDEWDHCALCPAWRPLSLHHLIKHPRDDVRGNLVMLCGSGTTGCHGLIEAHDPVTMLKLAAHLMVRRLDAVAHISWRAYPEQPEHWIERTLGWCP